MGKRVTLSQQVENLTKQVTLLMQSQADKQGSFKLEAPKLASDQEKFINERALRDAFRPVVSMKSFCDVRPPEVQSAMHKYVTLAQDKKDHTLNAVKFALRLMKKVWIVDLGPTCFNVEIRRSWPQVITVECFYDYISVTFTQRSGRVINERHSRNSDAAASIAGVAMFYCMKHY